MHTHPPLWAHAYPARTHTPPRAPIPRAHTPLCTPPCSHAPHRAPTRAHPPPVHPPVFTPPCTHPHPSPCTHAPLPIPLSSPPPQAPTPRPHPPPAPLTPAPLTPSPSPMQRVPPCSATAHHARGPLGGALPWGVTWGPAAPRHPCRTVPQFPHAGAQHWVLPMVCRVLGSHEVPGRGEGGRGVSMLCPSGAKGCDGDAGTPVALPLPRMLAPCELAVTAAISQPACEAAPPTPPATLG